MTPAENLENENKDYLYWLGKLTQRGASLPDINHELFSFDEKRQKSLQELGFSIFDLLGMLLAPNRGDYENFCNRPLEERKFVINHDKGLSFLAELAKRGTPFWQWLENLFLRDEPSEEIFNIYKKTVKEQYLKQAVACSWNSDASAAKELFEKTAAMIQHSFESNDDDLMSFSYQLFELCPGLENCINIDAYLKKPEFKALILGN